MASGKTTFGQALARRTGRQFVDLDQEIERREGRTIPEIIASDGEARFRQIESMTLKSTVGMKNAVIACGGGTPCHRDNMEFMTLHGVTLWLVASPERLAERILEAGATRPLVAGKDPEELDAFIRRHLLERQPYYCRASLRLNSEHLETPEEIEATVDTFLQSQSKLK